MFRFQADETIEPKTDEALLVPFELFVEPLLCQDTLLFELFVEPALCQDTLLFEHFVIVELALRARWRRDDLSTSLSPRTRLSGIFPNIDRGFKKTKNKKTQAPTVQTPQAPQAQQTPQAPQIPQARSNKRGLESYVGRLH